MQGIPAGFSLTVLTGYMAANGIPAVTIGSFIAVASIPWAFQFVWGPLIDRFQFSSMGHRKQWLVLAQCLSFLASLSLLIVRDPLYDLPLLGALFFTHSLFASIQDAAADAMIIDIVPPHERGRANGLMRGGFLAGLALGSAGLSLALHSIGFRGAVLCQSAVLLTFTVVTLLLRLRPMDAILPGFKRTPGSSRPSQPSLRVIFSGIAKGIFRQPGFSYFLLILLVYTAFSVFIRTYSFTLIHDLNWSDQRLSILQGSWGTILMLVIVFGGGALADRLGALRIQRLVMLGVAIFLIGFNLLSAYWSDGNVAATGLVVWNFADPLFSVGCFPILMGMCVKPAEGSQFTAYMALINLCDVTGSWIAGHIMATTAPARIGLCCGVVILLVWMVFKKYYPREGVTVA